MGKYMYFYPKSEEAYIDIAGVKISSVSVKHVYEIAQTLKKLGLETDEFLRIFRVYEDEYFKTLNSEEKTAFLRKASEFILESEEIKEIRDFSKKAIPKIEKAVNIGEIHKKMEKVPHLEIVYKYIDKFEVDCYDARAHLMSLLAFCEKALELGVKLRVS